MILVSDLCVFYRRSMVQRKLPIVNPVCSASAVNLAHNRLEYQHSMSIHRRHLLRNRAFRNRTVPQTVINTAQTEFDVIGPRAARSGVNLYTKFMQAKVTVSMTPRPHRKLTPLPSQRMGATQQNSSMVTHPHRVVTHPVFAPPESWGLNGKRLSVLSCVSAPAMPSISTLVAKLASSLNETTTAS